MLSANNTTLQDFLENNTDRQLSVTFVILLVFLVVTGTLANGYIIVALLKKSRRSPLNMTIVNLAVVDTLILLLVIPMCLVTLTLPGVTPSLCSINGLLGQLLTTYSLQVQCVILYANVRVVTRVSPNNRSGVGLMPLTLISATCLAVDTFAVLYPGIKYGTLQKLPSVGYCILITNKSFLWGMLVVIFYIIYLSITVLLCTIFYIVLTRFVRKNSARPELARQRHVLIFKMVFRKVLIWIFTYTFITVARSVGFRNRWPEVTFQVSYFLLWSSSVLNPLCYILTSPLRRAIFPRKAVTVAPQRAGQPSAQHYTNQHDAQQSSRLVNRPTKVTELVTQAPESHTMKSLPWENRIKEMTQSHLSIPFVIGSAQTTQFVTGAQDGIATGSQQGDATDGTT